MIIFLLLLSRFPSGIKALADYVHKLGLKFGIYADYGTRTCAGYPGSLGHLETDARTFAEWGVDYVKVIHSHSQYAVLIEIIEHVSPSYLQFDGCHSDPATMDQGFPQFGAALAATGRS